MKVDCEIVRDLMPLVTDGTASEKSCDVVEEHVTECESCREMLEEMRQEVGVGAPKEDAGPLVKKLRRRRRLRSAVLVLLGVAASVIVLAACFSGWQYYFNSYNVLTAQEDYEIELVPEDFYGMQMILTIRDGHEQIPHAAFDRDTGDLYLWSDTTRLPWPARSGKKIIGLSDLFYFGDIGYAERIQIWDEETRLWYTDVMPVNHVYKGAIGEPEDSLILLSELANPPDEALVKVWRARLADWGVELNPPPQAE